MFDSLTIARRLTAAGVSREQADVMADVIRQGAEHGDHIMPDALGVELATLRADITLRCWSRWQRPLLGPSHYCCCSAELQGNAGKR